MEPTGVHPINNNDSNVITSVVLPAVIILFVILAGVGTGWFLVQRANKGSQVGVQNTNGYSTAPGASVGEGGKEVGSTASNFKDTAEGILQKGGIDGEGTHHLDRPGGASQTVYLTSSVVDLDQFIGKKVEVAGETIQGKKAGWLMDVGRVKILE